MQFRFHNWQVNIFYLLGFTRTCSPIHLGEDCKFVTQFASLPNNLHGEQKKKNLRKKRKQEYRICYRTCDSDGCNSASRQTVASAFVSPILQLYERMIESAIRTWFYVLGTANRNCDVTVNHPGVYYIPFTGLVNVHSFKLHHGVSFFAYLTLHGILKSMV